VFDRRAVVEGQNTGHHDVSAAHPPYTVDFGSLQNLTHLQAQCAVGHPEHRVLFSFPGVFGIGDPALCIEAVQDARGIGCLRQRQRDHGDQIIAVVPAVLVFAVAGR
jgi:hypothetical protein